MLRKIPLVAIAIIAAVFIWAGCDVLGIGSPSPSSSPTPTPSSTPAPSATPTPSQTPEPAGTGTSLWARSLSTGSSDSEFVTVAKDGSGNTYAVGYIYGTDTYTFGAGVAVTGPNADYCSALLVKYNASGTALWAQTVSSESNESWFNGVATDTSGNVYAVGYVYDTGTYDFGNSVTAAGDYTQLNAVLVKYSASGTPQWAKVPSGGGLDSNFDAVAADSSGNVYAAGYFRGAGTFDFGNNISATGATNQNNAFVVKYNTSGVAQWASTSSTGSAGSEFFGIASDNSGNLYAGGYISGTDTFTYGNVTVNGSYGGANGVVVKYNTSGTAQWAKSVTSGPSHNYFNAIAADSSGNVYVAGTIRGTSTYDFGDGATTAGTFTTTNAVLVKYNSSGTTQWAKSVTSGSSYSQFNGVAADNSGNAYVVGYVAGSGHNFGNSVTTGATGAVLVKYDTSGNAQFAKTSDSYFNGIGSDSSGHVYAAGYISGSSSVDFGNGVTVAGSGSAGNVLLVKYE